MEFRVIAPQSVTVGGESMTSYRKKNGLEPRLAGP
jgi:hypothetical protein